LKLVGKGGYHRRQLNAVGGLASLHDSLTGTEFLVDNCAAVSVLPHWGASSELEGADGKGIVSWGAVMLET
jgi:hypothetical protein